MAILGHKTDEKIEYTLIIGSYFILIHLVNHLFNESNPLQIREGHIFILAVSHTNQ